MKLFNVVATVLKMDPSMINAESSAQNTKNWDSLRHIEMILAVENAFGVQFSIPEIVSMQKLGDMIELLTQKGAQIESVETRRVA